MADGDVVVKRRPAVPTINEIAHRAGVSKGLVSFVVNQRPGAATPRRHLPGRLRELNRRTTVDLGHIRIAYVARDQQYLHARRHRGALRGPCGPPALRTGPEGTDFTMAAGVAVTRALPDQPPTAAYQQFADQAARTVEVPGGAQT